MPADASIKTGLLLRIHRSAHALHPGAATGPMQITRSSAQRRRRASGARRPGFPGDATAQPLFWRTVRERCDSPRHPMGSQGPQPVTLRVHCQMRCKTCAGGSITEEKSSGQTAFAVRLFACTGIREVSLRCRISIELVPRRQGSSTQATI